jgi:hypothetical protein
MISHSLHRAGLAQDVPMMPGRNIEGVQVAGKFKLLAHQPRFRDGVYRVPSSGQRTGKKVLKNASQKLFSGFSTVFHRFESWVVFGGVFRHYFEGLKAGRAHAKCGSREFSTPRFFGPIFAITIK